MKNYNWSLRRAIKEGGYTYNTLSEKTQIHPVKICRIVIGKAIPDWFERKILSKVLKKSQKKLFKRG